MLVILYKYIVLLAFSVICSPVFSQSDSILYSFFVAGHTYGHPENHQSGLYPPFLKEIDSINNNKHIELGVLTGDIVPEPTDNYLNSAKQNISQFNVPVYVAAGNHDISPGFKDRFGDYYFSFIHKNDLFIILTPSLDKWNISGEQKDFLIKTLEKDHKNVDNVFIFLHELIWWSPENEFRNIEINYRPHYPGKTNFHDEIEPLLKKIPNNIVIFAGDLGCTDKVSAYMYYKYDNITLVASGMGGGVNDNYIVVNVLKNRTLNYELVALQGNRKRLGRIENFDLP